MSNFKIFILLIFVSCMKTDLNVENYSTQSEQIVNLIQMSSDDHIVVFWTLNCGFCIKELKDLTNQNQIKVTALSLENISNEEAEKELNKKIKANITFDVITHTENRKIFESFNVRGVPLSMVFKNKQMKEINLGYKKYNLNKEF